CFPPPPPPDGGYPDVVGVDVVGVDVPRPPPTDGGTSMQCPTGLQPCGLPGQSACPFNYYCITGCCLAAPP
ncbi:MAG: hypothetical protein WCJ30_14070, partial [Deltaproteobacteria bacterium]